MIIKRLWTKHKNHWRYVYTGWFLFGFIPLYIRQEQ